MSPPQGSSKFSGSAVLVGGASLHIIFWVPQGPSKLSGSAALVGGASWCSSRVVGKVGCAPRLRISAGRGFRTSVLME